MNILKPIRVLIVDDSAVVRTLISRTLSADPQIEVVGTVCDPYIARDQILKLNPDVLTLDIEMPRMDGLTFMRILQQHRPMPVIVISSLTQRGSQTALEALELGAVHVLAKPSSANSIGALGDQLCARIKEAAVATFRKPGLAAASPATPAPAAALPSRANPRQLVLFGASTGGTTALPQVLRSLPANMPGICIVQHIPAYFSRAFAERMSQECAFKVREAAHGNLVRPGLALVAPGDYHMELRWNGSAYQVSLNQGDQVHHCRPAVDVLFNSVARCPGARVVAALLTGMGTDGALGMKALRAAGANTLAQDEKSCVVYGMPKAAVEAGAAESVLPLQQMAPAILKLVHKQAGSAPVRRTLNSVSA